jgi:hypothetical protein
MTKTIAPMRPFRRSETRTGAFCVPGSPHRRERHRGMSGRSTVEGATRTPAGTRYQRIRCGTQRQSAPPR